jgi:hypothetical protein
MVRRFFITGIVLLFVFFGTTAADQAQPIGTEEDKIAYELLDRYVSMFQEMAEKGTGGKDKVERALQGMMQDVKKVLTEKHLDPVFFHRFTRLLMVTKLTIVEDQQGVFAHLIDQEVGAFVKDMKGVEAEVTGKEAIGVVADAMAQAVLELHIYLDTKKDRLKLMEEWDKRLKSRAK